MLVAGCILDIDLVLESSNHVVFGAHKRNLELYSEGFPIAQGTNSENEVVILSEGGLVLYLLLAFMHNTEQPDLSKFGFSTLALFAEAVEKYMVFSARQVCKMHMEFVHLLLLLSGIANIIFHQKSRRNPSIGGFFIRC